MWLSARLSSSSSINGRYDPETLWAYSNVTGEGDRVIMGDRSRSTLAYGHYSAAVDELNLVLIRQLTVSWRRWRTGVGIFN